ncbi:MAG TPA: hypothetical protein P5056_03570 [Candidatus Paceibacterota bacterium]|nr:hypothetical protein [Candidatus Paceibacterota bacterium]
MSKKFTFAVLAMFIACLGFAVNTNTAAAADILSVTAANVDQNGNALGGQVALGAGWQSTPHTYENITDGTTFFAKGSFGGLSNAGVYVIVKKDTTIKVDVETNKVVSTVSTPGISKVEFVFNVLPITVATVDQNGNPLSGTVMVSNLLAWSASPQTIQNVPSGVKTSFYAKYNALSGSMAGTIIGADTSYAINISTGVVTKTATPGVNKVEFVFEVLSSITAANVDQNGNALGGQVALGAGWQSTPHTYENITDGTTFFAKGSFGGLSNAGVYVIVKKDTTIKVDVETNKVVSTVSTPGISKVEFVFNVLPITVATVDQNGNPLSGTVMVSNLLAWSASPQTIQNVASGAKLTAYAKYDVISVAGTAYTAAKDTTTKIDAETREITSVSTPGINKVEFVFKSATPADTIPPVTTITISSAAGQNGWYIAPVEVSLTASDEGGSGLKETRICVDQNDLCVPVAGNSAEINAEGKNYFRYFSLDSAENSEVIKSETVNIDNTAPVSSVLAEDTDNDTLLNTSSVSLSATDSGSGVLAIKYSFDNGEIFTTSSNPATVEIPAGLHVLTLFSVDNAGNTEAVQNKTYNSPDACPSKEGKIENNGCPMAIVANVTVITHDQSKGGICGTLPNGKPRPNCKLPLTNSEVKVFDMSDSGFINAFGAGRLNHKAAEIFASQNGLAGSCTTNESGICKVGVGNTGKYFTVAKMVDGSNEVYAGKESDLFSDSAETEIIFSKFIDKSGDVEYKHEGLALVPIVQGKWPFMLAFLGSLFSKIL